MEMTLCKQSALAVMRSLRAASAQPFETLKPSENASAGKPRSMRTDLVSPNPSPGKRWTRKLVDELDLGLSYSFAGKTLHFAVPDAASRIRMKNSTSTVYARGLPAGSFIRTSCSTEECGLIISSPELLFAELAKEMHPIEHLMLGHELCGTFSRDAEDPYNGPITYGVRPVTSAERIIRFLDGARNMHGLDAARASAQYLNDNAWSPTESLIAALLRLPIDSLGYDLGSLTLNPRISPAVDLPGMAESRVPDIMIDGTPVGLNYDGAVHLDLDSIVRAARDLESNPELAEKQRSLASAVRNVRAKVVDDIRRNRELAADGLVVFPVVKEDLYGENGMNQIVAHLITTIEQLTKRDMSEQKKVLRMRRLSEARRRVVLSLLPGKSERNVHVGRFIYGHEICEGPQEIHSCWVEL